MRKQTSAGENGADGSNGNEIHNGQRELTKSDTITANKISMNMPFDIFTKSNIKPAPLPDFQPLKDEVRASPNDISVWEKLFSKIDGIFVTSLEGGRQFSQEFKVLVDESYNELLDRFPYLVSYWQKFSIAKYQLSGAQASIDVLSASVNSCQYSLDLWDDYLNALSMQKDPRYECELKSCLALNEQNFNSDRFWDKYLEFVKQADNEDSVYATYLKLIKIPVYEYARYYEEYSQLDRLKVLNHVPHDELSPFLGSLNKEHIDECTEVEKYQIVQEYSDAIFQNTQTRVTDKWNHESVINNRQLNLQDLSDQKELAHWISYLDYELENGTYESIVNLFEQCLIPNCFNERVWLKYLAYLNFSDNVDQEKRFMFMDSVYSRANNKFLPLDQITTRLTYGKFLIKFEKANLMNDYNLDLIKYFSGDNYSKLYLKGPYLSSIKCLLENWQLLFDESAYEELLLCLIKMYTDGEKLVARESIRNILDESYINILLKYINDQAIPIVMQMYLNHYLAAQALTNDRITILRKFFQKHYSEPYLSGYSDFWKFYLEFEGLCMYNFGNVNTIINYIKQNTTLPILVVNKFLKFQYDLFNANLADFLTQLPNNDCLINFDNNTRISLQNPSLSRRFNKVHLSKQLEYPGVKVEFKPDITNKLMSDKDEFSLLNDKVPSLPSFKNVEKANAPVSYPKE